MSFEIDGKTWIPESTSEHTESIMTKINSILQENSITDSDGNIIQLRSSFANAFYLLAVSLANSIADNDTKLQKAINSFNIALCDDNQIENLLPIAGITRNEGSYSTLKLKATATSDGDCTIPEGTLAPFGDYNFVVQSDILIASGTSQEFTTVCDTPGAVTVLKGEVTAFDTSIANLDSVINTESSTVGTEAETTNELRQRLLSGNTIKYSLSGCKSALEELTGISYARIFFNTNIDQSITLDGGCILKPRHAYIVVYGSNDSLAETYAEYMNAPTQNGTGSEGTATTVVLTITASSQGDAVIPSGTTVSYNSLTFKTSSDVTVASGESSDITFTCTVNGDNEVPEGSITALDTSIDNVDSVVQNSDGVTGNQVTAREMDYVTSSGQVIPIYYDVAREQKVYVKIVLKSDSASDEQTVNQLKRDLIKSSASWSIGEEVTSLLTDSTFTDATYAKVSHTLVSSDGTDWTNNITVGCNVLPRVSDSTIEVEQL